MRNYIVCDLPVSGYTVAYVGNRNPDMTPDERVSWWVVPGTMKED